MNYIEACKSESNNEKELSLPTPTQYKINQKLEETDKQ